MFNSWTALAGNGAAVILVLALLLLSVWALRRKGLAHWNPGSALRQRQRRLSVVERLPLTSQHSLYLVQMTDRLWLLGSSPGGISMIEAVGDKSATSPLAGSDG